MFRKLTDRISSAANAVRSSEDPNVRQLTAMGFDATAASNALQATNGNVDRAAELLLSSSAPATTTASATATSEEETLQRVMQESLALEQQQQRNNRAPRSAASAKAGQAAACRAAGLTAVPIRTKSGGLSHHPEVKMIPHLNDKPKEEQILRTADRLKNSSAAVDTLYKALSAVQANPEVDKFRKIDKTTAGYQCSVAGAPGAEDLLRAMNYRPSGSNFLVLDRAMVDPALLYLGISALEQTKQTPEYKADRQKRVFSRQLREIQTQADESVDEAVERANYMSQCPTEPPEGRGALVQVVMADQTIRRRFDGDDQLKDVLAWLGGHGSGIPQKILSREWSLVDANRYPVAPMDCVKQKEDTLQYIGCWPSGRLEILPSTEEWMAGGERKLQAGLSRGLGSALSDDM